MAKKILAGILLTGVFALSGCFGMGSGSQVKNPIQDYDYSSMHLVQFDEPYEGQPTATIETTVGTIKAVLYPKYAPNTVKNFIDRANEGYYNGKDIYGILNGCIFLSGSENEKRNSGVTGDGKPIENEYSVDLWTFKGALCSYYGASGYGDSRFFIVNEQELTDEDMASLREVTDANGGQLLPEELITAFKEKGSVAGLAGRHTVFGQTTEGFDVIAKICASEISGDFAEPVTPIYINSITIGEYHAG